MKPSASDLLWSAALGAEVTFVFLALVLICIGAWEAHKSNKRKKATQKSLRESKEAEAHKSAKDDKIFEEVEAFYDGI